jgi:putative oxidoreductase
MRPILSKLEAPIYVFLRIVVGFLFLCHGLQKLFGAFGGSGRPHGLPLAAGVIECVCGTLVLIGLVGSLAAFIAAGEMAVAYFYVHAKMGFWLWPIVNHGELAVAYCFVFLYIAARGSGPLSVDSLLGRK